MNKPVVFAIGLIFGGAAGAGITYMALRRGIDERIEAEVEEFKKDYQKREKGRQSANKQGLGGGSEGTNPERHSEGSKGGKDEKIVLEKPSGHRTRTSLDEKQPEIQHTEYHKVAENYMKPSPEVGERMVSDVDPADLEHPEDDGPSFSFISAEEANRVDPDKITYLIWDPDENILQDEYGELIENREYLVGDLLDTLLEGHRENGLTTPLESTHYILNSKIDQVYEVETVADADAGVVND